MTAVAVTTLDQLAPNATLRVVIDGLAIAVVRDSEGAVHAIGDRCSHGDVSLADGFVEGDQIECWAHGARFDLNTGQALRLPAYEPVPVFEARVAEDGTILVDPDITLTPTAEEA